VLALDAFRVPLGPTSVAVGLVALNGLLFSARPEIAGHGNASRPVTGSRTGSGGL